MGRSARPYRTDKRRWGIVRRRVFDRDGWRCRACGRPGRLECDHVKPIDQGGAAWDLDNLQALCRGCHIAKTQTENAQKKSPQQQRWGDMVGELMG